MSNNSTLTIILFVFAAGALVAAYLAFQRMLALQRKVDRLNQARAKQDEAMRARTRATYELAFAMSSILKYENVLDTALDAGRLGLRMVDRETESLTSAVLLFHTEDNLLHPVAARRFARSDMNIGIPGKEGIIARALTEAEPILGDNVSKDPELRNFSALNYTRSLLVIPLNAGFDNYGVLLYAGDKPNLFSEEHTEVLTAIGGQVTIALQNALLYRSLIQEKERIVAVDEEARKKLARDLHDGPTQSIAAIAMRMSIVYRLLERDPQQAMPELKKIEDLARSATKEIRQILFTLRPLVLETQGLGSALQQFADKMRETYGQMVEVRIDRQAEDALSRHQQGVIFYIVEEAVNNARKHAQAELIRVSVRRDGGWVVIQIADNGVGFDVDAVNSSYDVRGSFGMINMRERAELIEGTLDLKSAVGSGTTITVSIPLDPLDPTGRREASGVRQRPQTTKLAVAAARARMGNG